MPTPLDPVARFESNLAEHALFIYQCDYCGRYWGRYIFEEMITCECGKMPDKHVMVVDPETLISAWLNNGKVLCQPK